MLRFLVLACVLSANSFVLAADGWRAGVARVKVTPSEPMYMAGYASRKTPSEGVLSDLYVKVLVLADAQDKRAVWLTSDLISIPQPLREQVAERIKEKYKIDPAALLMNCSHTHCGPVVRDNVETSVMYQVEPEHAKRIETYFIELRDKIVDAIGTAIDSMDAAKLGYSYARCGFAMNRRLPSSTGYQNSPYPAGLSITKSRYCALNRPMASSSRLSSLVMHVTTPLLRSCSSTLTMPVTLKRKSKPPIPVR